ncbi:substrate-binding domain-containing protein [uncultured Muribaculum sp.]|uniref:hybrid sensor histidine kinase/response regulator transcription factor n=5 Tax=Pseudomonadati TaxID=3379134 RepID=UPI000F49D471|nr:substrate-binding domain-containing protein [uncultured Muribaculum sp.]ROT15616.1 response regulator [Muribaculaceae bacterium Isolate-102 (HZI)]
MHRKICHIIFIVIMLSVFQSCKEETKYRIGVSQCSNDDWRTKMNEEIQREIMFHPEATVEIRSADDSNEKQIADIRYFADNGFDIIIAAPNEADAITPVIEEVYDAGIPVIVFDRNINGDSYTAYQGVDNVGIGKSAADYARHLLPDGGNVIEIHGLAGSTPAVGRHEGFAKEAELKGIDIIASAYGNWNYEDAAIKVDSLLNIYEDVDLIYAHNDRMAIAASDVARKHGKDIRIIGIDAAPEIGIKAVADSVIDATFLYPTEGYRLIRTALNILSGRPYEREKILPLSSAVDLSNADILLLQNESLEEETSKIKYLKSQVDDYWNRHSAQTSLFYAMIIILLLLFGVLFLVLRAFWQRKKHQNVLMSQNKILEEQRDTQRELNEQLNAATQSKLVFFTNVSHDLRTPLTLIAEPVEQLAVADNLTPQQSMLMKIANKNVKILRRLINQILDFRKYENGKLNLNLVESKFGTLVKEWAESFNSIARKRDITLTVDVTLDKDFTLAVDAEKIERVFFNLMSNAFKYTPDNGSIKFSCGLDGDNLRFSIEDTGHGIGADDINNIFDRFYQVDKIHPNGSGIGLSLAKAFVELHGGSIAVESILGVGSKFTVTLPVVHVEECMPADTDNLITKADVNAELDRLEEVDRTTTAGTELPLLLVIDDNADIRRMIGELLKDEYNIVTAPDGREGVRLAAKYVPDLIICDVMMPVMDGLECCRIIKDEVSTSHIPVLMLTACSMDEQRARGYDSGADGYLSKPFNSTVLKSRCRNLIDNRKRIKNLWSSNGGGDVKAKERNASVPVNDVDSEFYSKVLDIMKKEMGNPDLNVDSLASMMGLGRSQFYRKIKALTNYSPVELLRNLRLKQAREMLTTTEKTIGEIAYEVGFSSPAYFTRCYREAFDETPTELRERIAFKK